MLGIQSHLLCLSLFLPVKPCPVSSPVSSPVCTPVSLGGMSRTPLDTKQDQQKQKGREQRGAEYRRRYAKTNKKSVEALLLLATWAKENGLPVKAKVVYRKILRIDANNEIANSGLGRQLFEGRWVKKDEIEQILAVRAEAEKQRIIDAEAKRKRDMLILPDEEAAKSKVTDSIEELLDESDKLLKEFAEATGADEDMYCVVSTEHCQIVARLSDEDAARLAQIGEYVYRRLNWITYGKEDNDTFRAGAGKHLFYFVTPGIYEQSAIFIAKNYRGDMPVKEAQRLSQDPECKDSFYWDLPKLAMHLATTKKFMSSLVANGMGHHWLVFSARAARKEIDVESGKPLQYDRGHLMVWMEEAVGLWASIDSLGDNRYWRLGSSTYFRKGRTDKEQSPTRQALVDMVHAILERKPLGGGMVKNFFQLSKSQLNQLSRDDLAMAWSVVDYLINERTDDWRALIKDLASANSFKHSFIRVFGQNTERRDLDRILEKTRKRRLLDELYKGVCSRFDQAWRNWAEEHYDETEEVEPPFERVGK